MGNLEKPLTWVLGIAFVGYLFIANCECSEETTCPLNNGFNISNTDLNGDVLKTDEDITEDTDPPSLGELGYDTVAINKYRATARRILQAGDSVAPGSPPGVVWVVDRETGKQEDYFQVQIGGIIMFEKAIAPFFITNNGDTIFPYTHSYRK